MIKKQALSAMALELEQELYSLYCTAPEERSQIVVYLRDTSKSAFTELLAGAVKKRFGVTADSLTNIEKFYMIILGKFTLKIFHTNERTGHVLKRLPSGQKQTLILFEGGTYFEDDISIDDDISIEGLTLEEIAKIRPPEPIKIITAEPYLGHGGMRVEFNVPDSIGEKFEGVVLPDLAGNTKNITEEMRLRMAVDAANSELTLYLATIAD